MTSILFLLSHTEKGGGEVVIYNLIKNLDRSGFKPFLGQLDFRKGAFIHEFKKLGIEPVDFRASHLRNFPIALAVVLRLVRFIRKNSIGIIFTSGAHNHIYAALAKKMTGVRVVTYVMNYYQPLLNDNPLIVRSALRLGADYYLVASLSCLQALKGLIPVNAPRRVVYHGVDKDFVNQAVDVKAIRRDLGLKQGDKLVSIIGRLQRWKGQDVFLRAASLIAEKRGRSTYFCLVGGSLFGMEENYPKELSDLICVLGLAGQCRMVGHKDNVADWISASDIVVHASKAPEPGATAVIEAMALGKPVVATRCGAPGELIDDGISGILCEPNSPESLASAVMALLDDEKLASRIGNSARSVAFQRFSAERMSREIEDALKSVAPKNEKCILFTFSSSKIGGHEISMRNIIKVLDRQRYKPLAVFLCLEKEGGLPDELCKMGVEVFIKNIGRLRNPLNALKTVSYLLHLIIEKNVKLVFTSGGHNHPYGRMASLLTRCPVVTHETFMFKRYFWQNGPIRTLNFLLGADAYVSCGRLAAETLRRAALWNPIVYYLPFMVDFEVFDYRKSGFPLRRRLFIPENVFVFSMVARIQEWKGQDVFVEAAMRILKEAPDTYFLIFGEPTFDRDRVFFDYLRNKVEASGLKKQIILAGYMAESVYAYAASDVICHCSKTPEPFGMVIIEAFAMKKPVIATACGGPLESVEDGKNGYLVSPANVEELVSAMKRCLKEKSRMAEMGEHGYRKAMEVYSPEKFAAKINSFISEYTRN